MTSYLLRSRFLLSSGPRSMKSPVVGLEAEDQGDHQAALQSLCPGRGERRIGEDRGGSGRIGLHTAPSLSRTQSAVSRRTTAE
ncbi:hypothetical protein NQZ68_012099 [Dissostichus eleginoides]|nr:hypothetical protein NQZ68_012099 [Dissostichus eleginoides]